MRVTPLILLGLLSAIGCTRDATSDGTPDLACTGSACATTGPDGFVAIGQECGPDAPTTISGTVFAPNGTLPLYNAAVFVPTVPLEPFAPNVTCDRCDGQVSGSPVAVARTGPDGRFTLTGVPAGVNVPLVIQLGRWRRQVTIPTVNACDTTVVDGELTRLPRNSTEGDIPQMAIATGAADPFECLLLKIGLDAAEFTLPSQAGRVHFYRATDKPGLDLAAHAPRANELYASLDKMLEHDVVILPCETAAYDKSLLDGVPLDPDPRGLFEQYVNAGGRLFATHYSYDWLTYANSPFNKVANPTKASGQWPVKQSDDWKNTIAGQVVTSFPKGADFAAWLGFAGATSAPGTLNIDEGRHDLTGVDPKYARDWINFDFSAFGSGNGVMHMTFNTPLDAPPDSTGEPAYCGRVVFSDFHVTAGSLKSSQTTLPFPDACGEAPMTDQEKALAFMLFDLSSCVQDDGLPPIL